MTGKDKDEGTKGGEASVGKAMKSYLDRKGYRQISAVESPNAKVASIEAAAFDMYNEQDTSLSNAFSFSSFQAASDSSSQYEIAYSKLKKWIEDSLDIFKNELYLLLYPVFVHCYLDLIARGSTNEAKAFMEHFKGDHTDIYMEDLAKLQGIMDPLHLKENQLAYTFRNNKYNLSLSSYSFDLFISFMQENSLTMLLKIVNQYLNIKVYGGKPKSTAEEEAPGITGMAERASSVNSQQILWGTLPLDPNFETELAKQLKDELAKVQKYPDQMQSLIHQIKKLKEGGAGNSFAPQRSRVPLPPQVPSIEIERVKELSKKANLGRNALPSICCYTFHNTYEGLNSIEFSPDSTLVAGGFSDSFIEVWSLKNQKLRALKPSTELARIDINDSPIDDLKEYPGSDVKRLVGHSGPVYSTKFSSDNRFMISCSQDATLRLWSLDLFSNLVAYKGHNYSVWDCDYGPLGLYFASASADKTARLWSMEHISPLRIFAGHLSDVDVVKFHPNSNYIATGSSDRTVRLWDIQTGNCVRLFTGHSSGVTAMAFSHDGRHLVSAGLDKKLNIWDLGSGKCLKKMQLVQPNGTATTQVHEKAVYSVEFSLDNTLVVSGGADGEVRVWDCNKTAGSAASKYFKLDFSDLLGSFSTKQTAIYTTHFTFRNVVMAGGVFGAVPS